MGKVLWMNVFHHCRNPTIHRSCPTPVLPIEHQGNLVLTNFIFMWLITNSRRLPKDIRLLWYDYKKVTQNFTIANRTNYATLGFRGNLQTYPDTAIKSHRSELTCTNIWTFTMNVQWTIVYWNVGCQQWNVRNGDIKRSLSFDGTISGSFREALF